MSLQSQDGPGVSAQANGVQDRRPKPPGVLPRHVQMWVMVSLAVVILVIIFVTGHTTSTLRTANSVPAASPTLAPADRIRSFQQQLAADEARQQELSAQQAAVTRESVGGMRTSDGGPETPDPIAEERRRRDYQSLFADNIALSRRPTGEQPYAESGARPTFASFASPANVEPLAALPRVVNQTPALVPARDLASTPAAAPSVAPTAGQAIAPEAARDEHPAPGPRFRLLEGTVIETALVNRLDGTFTGPVSCLVTTPVYSQDRQSVLIPAGARVQGNAAPVQSWGDSRLAVTFHRLVMPDGHTYNLDRFKGLDQIGAAGLRDSVNHHYLQVFGASLAIGAISGLAQYNTTGGVNYTFGDTYRQAAGASLAQSTSRVLDRYLNVLPTITIREGFRVNVYLTNDLELPAYVNTQGGAQ